MADLLTLSKMACQMLPTRVERKGWVWVSIGYGFNIEAQFCPGGCIPLHFEKAPNVC